MIIDESKTINISRFIFVLGILFIHFKINCNQFEMEGIDMSSIGNTPFFDIINVGIFLTSSALFCLFFLSSYLYFVNIDKYTIEVYSRKVDSRFRSIVIPFIVWNAIWLIYTLLKNYTLAKNGVPLVYTFNSLSDVLRCFWATGQGSDIQQSMPIAGYTWYLRDLFVFSLLAPIYYYLYNKKLLSVLGLLFAICSVTMPFVVFYNSALFIGGYMGYRKISLLSLLNTVSWVMVFIALVVVNVLYYMASQYVISQMLIIAFSLIIVLKIAYWLRNNKWICEISTISTYLYLSHILVINIGRHFIIKLVNPTSDLGLCVCYICIASFCLIVCFLTYYLMKMLKADRLIEILTGGRS